MVRILGIDPGLNATGYGMIQIAEDERPQLFKYGSIRTVSKQPLAERLHKIYQSLDSLIREAMPDIIAIEDIFYAENVKTAIVMGHARGAAIVAAVNNKVDVREYSPKEIKMSVVGNGAAGKSQVQFMVQRLLNLREKIDSYDASDALAVALCHWHRSKLRV